MLQPDDLRVHVRWILPSFIAVAPAHHPRNRHQGRYDFAALARACPELSTHVIRNPSGEPTIDFADADAVRRLNQALLRLQYGIADWTLPPGCLCPPVPGRADYIHHLADLLAGDRSPNAGSAIKVLDIGVGANCVYPIVGVAEYDWSFVGSDIDPVALASAQRIVDANPSLARKVELRRQTNRSAIFEGVIRRGERFAASMCNPPFHASAAAAAAGTARKLRNLAGGKRVPLARNFGGVSNELWCRGGEIGFVAQMIAESAWHPDLCRWFTTLVSQRDSLPPIRRALAAVAPAEIRTIDLAHGQKKTRIVAWRFA